VRQKLIKVVNEDGSISYKRSRYLTLVNVKPNQYGFKNSKGNFVEPTELELELYNESQTGGMHVTNGWLTFIGIITLINLFLQFLLIAKS